MAARDAAGTAASLEELRTILDRFEGCALRATATQLVFARGNPQARVMFVGEAPGYEEDKSVLSFVGRSGQLLDRMMAAIASTNRNAYIANIVPWRPPGNRTPTPQESAICLPFTLRQIELVNPDAVCLGGPSAQTLLNIRDGITKSRGWYLFPDRHTRNPRARHLPSGLPAAQPAAETARLARFPGPQEGAGDLIHFVLRREWSRPHQLDRADVGRPLIGRDGFLVLFIFDGAPHDHDANMPDVEAPNFC